jgi:hypothetical protein
MSLAQTVGIIVGVWLMAAPAALGYADATAADVHRIIGPVAASAALVAVWEATRGARLVNVVLGVLLVLAPLLVAHPADAAVSGVVSGVALAAASPVGGRSRQSMAGGWRSLSGQP